MAHVQSNRWSDGPGTPPERFLGSFLAERALTRGLAPARGALLGTVLGTGCWALVATLAWMAL